VTDHNHDDHEPGPGPDDDDYPPGWYETTDEHDPAKGWVTPPP
jgi:hypothetical protein